MLGDLLSGLGFTIVDERPLVAFSSPEMNRCTTAAAAFEIAKRLRSLVTGAAQADPKFDLGSVIDYSTAPPRRHAFMELQSATFSLSGAEVTVTVSPPAGLTSIELEKWEADRAEHEYQTRLETIRARLEPAYRSPRAEKMLELLAIANPSGETVYKIYELAEGHPKDRSAFHAMFAIPKGDFDRFRDAVHKPNVSGDWARHAYSDPPRTSNPMSKEEAERFVRDIADRWLAEVRAGQIQP